MRFTNNLKYLTFALVAAFIGFSCSSSNNSDGESATISGRVANDTQAKTVSAEFTTVAAAEVTSSGNIETIEGTETETDASGNFEIAVDAEAYQNLAVVAWSEEEGENADHELMGYVAAELENNSSTTIKPIDAESNAETKVFAELVASGSEDMVNATEIEAVVTSENAAEINSDSDNAAVIAAALENSAEVRAEYLEEEYGNEAESKSEFIASAMIEAQTDLEARLDASASAEAREQAYAEFNEAVINAYLDADIETSTSAKLVEMWGRVIINSTGSAESSVRNEINTQVSLMTALVIDEAVKVEMEAAGASESSQDAAADAGVQLIADIEASNGSESDIRVAFEAYHDEIRTTMENDANFSAEVVASVDAQINSSAGAKATFDSSIAAEISSNLVVDIYNSFFGNVEATVDSMSEMSGSEAEAFTEIMILINTAS